ncbi:Acriflavin resistance protein [Carbonactinospora thermoautotrophica]|uniref:Acriflavin resistance protein n=1 Tax=Carbonactinospora thermoautotrophica TaxID=1469144 RepID=A0A132MWT0_9ACTN|nr:efflux RND transporter permease subunit [Carbonactinospora thermoautotrophica]KWX02321.1 Acriflavin resistance protein [Carbonactinospora thermoautotrophica]
MSFLTRLSLANRSLVALAAGAVIAFGVGATTTLKQELIPTLELPAATVVTSYPGATPEIVEREVTEAVEGAVNGVDGLVDTKSTSSHGLSVVQAEFEYGTDTSAASQELQQAVNRIASRLPQGAQPTVVVGSTDDIPVVQLAVTSDGDQQRLAAKLRDEVVPELESIPGVREATVSGGRDRVVSVRLDPAKLAAAGLTPAAVTAALQANGVAVPGGTLTRGDRSFSVQVGDGFTSLEEIRDLPLTPQAGAAPVAAPGASAPPAPVRLGDVAKVETALRDATSFTRTNGKPSLGLGITKTPDGNAVEISHAVREKIPELEAALGDGARLTVVFDQAPFIEESIRGLTTEGLLGLGFAVLVILVFLLSIRSTLVTAVSIPLSVLIAMIGLKVGGHSLNILTLGALTIAVGRVVDDSIVVLENIKRHLGYGEPKHAAILTAVREVAGAVTASTITTVAVFLPIAVVGGQVGELFRPFAVTVTVALLASLLVSLTVIPVLAYWFLKPAAGGVEARERARARELRNPLQRVYLPVLRWAIGHRVVTLVLGAVVFLGTFGLVPRLETNFLDQGGNTFTVTQELPPGTSLARTDAAAKKVEEAIREVDGVETYQVMVGSSDEALMIAFGAGSGANSAIFSITTDVEADQKAVEAELRRRLGELRDIGQVRLSSGGGFGGAALQVVVRAPDQETLRAAAAQVEKAVRDTPDTADVVNDLAASQPTVRVRVDRAKAAAAGLGEAQIGQAVRQALQPGAVTTAELDGDRVDVVVRTGTAPADLAALRALPLGAGPAGPVTLDDVADVTETAGPVRLTRTDGARSATISANVIGQNLGAVTADLQRRIDRLHLPEGVSVELGGVSADQRESFADLGLALLAAIAIVFLVMVATFRSMVQPLILLVSVPFAATGAIGLLLATGTPLGVPALIGLLMLIGIVVTNAIVLIDLVNQCREQGMTVREAVLEGSRQRLRPILMTAVATICALAPMAFGLTGGGIFISQPLAIVVIGGLTSSTLLTLVLVPVLYTLVEGAKERLRARRQRRAAEEGRPDQGPEGGHPGAGPGGGSGGSGDDDPEPDGDGGDRVLVPTQVASG